MKINYILTKSKKGRTVEEIKLEIEREVKESNKLRPATGDDMDCLPKEPLYGTSYVVGDGIIELEYDLVAQGTANRYNPLSNKEGLKLIENTFSSESNPIKIVQASATPMGEVFMVTKDVLEVDGQNQHRYTIEIIEEDEVQDVIGSAIVNAQIVDNIQSLYESCDGARLFIRGTILKPKIKVEL